MCVQGWMIAVQILTVLGSKQRRGGLIDATLTPAIVRQDLMLMSAQSGAVPKCSHVVLGDEAGASRG